MTLKHPWEKTATETSIAAITYKKNEKANHLKRGLSVVTIPTSNSDGLKSADNTEDKQLMAVCKNKKQPNKIIKNFFSYTLTQLFSNHIFGDFEALKMDEYSRVNYYYYGPAGRARARLDSVRFIQVFPIQNRVKTQIKRITWEPLGI